MTETIAQIIISTVGVTAIYLTQQHHHPHWAKYAPILALTAQPAWMYSTYMASQWGIFALTFIYTYIWFIGFKKHWVDEPIELPAINDAVVHCMIVKDLQGNYGLTLENAEEHAEEFGDSVVDKMWYAYSTELEQQVNY